MLRLKQIIEGVVDVRETVRKEADYVGITIGNGIRKGFEDGFETVSEGFVKLMIASFSVVFGLIFASYGLASFLEEVLDTKGVGFLIIGTLALLLSLITFYSLKKK